MGYQSQQTKFLLFRAQMGIKTNGTVVTAQTGSANSTVPAEVRRDFEEHEPEVYYDEIEESDYVTDLDEVFDKS